MERYEWESLTTTGYALDLARRHSLEELAFGMNSSAVYLEDVVLKNLPVGGVLLAQFCRDQWLTPRQVMRYE